MKRITTILLIQVGILLTGSHNLWAGQREESNHIIVPGVGVGDYTVGMSKDEVLKKLGEPEAIQLGDEGVNVVRRGEEKYSLNNLPNHYILIFSNVSFWMSDNSIEGISVHSPLYKLGNGLGVGNSEQDIKQAFGKDFKPREEMGRNYLCYDAKGLAFAIDGKNQTATEIVIYYRRGSRVSKTADHRVLETLPKYDPNSENPFQIDLRGRDLSKLDLRASFEDLMYANFDDKTIWPAADRMPTGFDWQKIMELGKNPGLGVRSLHKKGITGRGVRVAIIDQRLLVGHQEYANRLRLYEEMNLPSQTPPEMHGAAVASIALGKTVGVAPEAELYYIAMQFFGGIPLQRLARCVDRILEVNRQLPKDNKIRVISISKGWGASDEGYKDITTAVQKARAAGMLVVCTSSGHVHEGFDYGTLGRSPLADSDVFESYEPGLFWSKSFWALPSSTSGTSFFVPMDSRTTASPAGNNEYVFYRIGGASWAIPYIAGVYALAVQADPAVTPERFWALAVQTGRTIELNRDGMKKPLGPIIDPVRLIRAIQLGETATLNRQQSKKQSVKVPVPTNSGTQSGVPEVRVGDPVEKVKQICGNDFQLREFEIKDILTYEDKGLSFEISKNNGTVMEINVFQAKRGKTDSPPGYRRTVLAAFESVGGKDLRTCDLRDARDILDTLGFNQETLWPPPERLPGGFDPKALLQEGMNPGLGVRALHAQGIIGTGVHVGLIDQPLRLDHPEYDGKIVSYYALDCGPHKSSMHGPGMASELVGNRCGTAPGASLHVMAVPSWKADASYYARALDRFVEYNESAPKDQKVRVVSVSAQPSGEGSVYKNQSLWDETVQRAQDKGILVLDCTWQHGFVSLCWLDPENRESVEACTPGFRNGTVEVDAGHIHVPSAPRTVAEADEDGSFGYAYDGGGRRSRRPKAKNGYSDTIPYAAGILALGWQIRPDLTPAQMKELLFASAYVHESGARIINPRAFIELIRKQGENQQAGRSIGKDLSTFVKKIDSAD
jgi:subtilisin family serine protease